MATGVLGTKVTCRTVRKKRALVVLGPGNEREGSADRPFQIGDPLSQRAKLRTLAPHVPFGRGELAPLVAESAIKLQQLLVPFSRYTQQRGLPAG